MCVCVCERERERERTEGKQAAVKRVCNGLSAMLGSENDKG